MLGKLIKYEWKATCRILLPLYGIYLITAILTNLFYVGDLSFFAGMGMFIFFSLSIACIVMTIVLLIQRFNTNLLQDEGYLMFTLPVSTPQLILSKMLIALAWGILGGLIGILGGVLLALNGDAIMGLQEVIEEIQPYLSMITWEYYALAIIFLLGSIIWYATFIMTVYASLSTGQLPIVSKYRRLVSLGCFLGFFIIFGNIASFVEQVVFDTSLTTPDPGSMLLPTGTAVIIEAAYLVALFFLTRYILKRHLNLE